MCKEIPIWEKAYLTLEEASAYFNIGINSLRKLCDENEWLVIWVGNRRLIRRKQFEDFLDTKYEV